MKRGKDVRVCVIGAGPSGITAAKHLLQAGIQNVVVYERNNQVGGNWIYSADPSHSSVYETTHIISSKKLSQYHDFPMPADYPDYPSHQQLLKYFQDYAKHFGVDKVTQFNTEVKHITKTADDGWDVTLSDGRVEHFDHLLVANGHHSVPKMPTYKGSFDGEFIHSHDFKHNRPFKDKRVLVIGGGNSACDIAVETSRVSKFTAISWRRGYHIVPKFVFGLPPDVMNERFIFLPFKVREVTNTITWWLVTGGNERYGLPKPKHSILSSHPTVNSELLYFIRHGRIHPRPDITQLDGKNVHFADGRVEEYDVIVAATGYKIVTPFFEPNFLDFAEGDVPLFMRVFHPNHRSLYFIGLVQPQGCIWPLADTQSELVANYIVGNYELPVNLTERINEEIDYINRTFVNEGRHKVEVSYHEYLGALRRELHGEVTIKPVTINKKYVMPMALAGAYMAYRALRPRGK
ncbi:MAG: NAD(P)-binding domain-containing protein [bacterium]|nr:NAD(P)-binding domain-containing protein [bacterium]